MEVFVSIIIPAYNSETTIKRCLECLLSQTFHFFEIIVVNDGSTDSTQSICESLGSTASRLKIINKTNGGVSAARNDGLKIAKGKYVTFVDSDDYVSPFYLEHLCNNNYKGYQPFDLVIVGAELVNVPFTNICLDAIANNIIASREFLIKHINSLLLQTPWAKLFSNKIIQQSNLFFQENLFFGEDTVFVMEYLSLCNSIVAIPEPDYKHLYRTNSKYKLSYENQSCLTKARIKSYEKLSQHLGCRIRVIEQSICSQYLVRIINNEEENMFKVQGYSAFKKTLKQIPFVDNMSKDCNRPKNNYSLVDILVKFKLYFSLFIFARYIRPLYKKMKNIDYARYFSNHTDI